MMEHVSELLNDIFQPHYECWLQRTDITALHVVGDGLTALAYYIIPIALFYATRKYNLHWQLKAILGIYAGFILLCGTTHIFDVIMVWYVSENLLLLDGVLRVGTGIFSVFSAIITVYSIYKLLELLRRFFGITIRMMSERKNLDRIKNETWVEFEELRQEILQHLNSGKDNLN